MKYFRFTLGGVFLLLGYLLFVHNEQNSPSAEKNFFSSEVFPSYFAAQGYSSFDHPKELNEQFIDTVRQTSDPEVIRKMFRGINLTDSYEQFLFKQIPTFKEGDFSNYLKTSLAALKNDPRFKKSKTTLSNDSYKEGNLPFLQFTLPNGTAVIRMGLPMIEAPYYQNLFFTPTVNPEFLAFVRSEKLHLYVNLMKREGLEGPSSYALEALEQKEPSYAAVTLDKNTDFYWQNGEYPENAANFKDVFMQKMLDPKGAYFFSKRLNDWPNELKEILNRVHTIYFDQATSLSKGQREDFIELTYLEILDHLVTKLKPESMNITCKHAIDRAPSLSVLWQLRLGYANENQVAALLLAPPLLMHNRTSHASRLDRFISALSFFYPKK